MYCNLHKSSVHNSIHGFTAAGFLILALKSKYKGIGSNIFISYHRIQTLSQNQTSLLKSIHVLLAKNDIWFGKNILQMLINILQVWPHLLNLKLPKCGQSSFYKSNQT